MAGWFDALTVVLVAECALLTVWVGSLWWALAFTIPNGPRSVPSWLEKQLAPWARTRRGWAGHAWVTAPSGSAQARLVQMAAGDAGTVRAALAVLYSVPVLCGFMLVCLSGAFVVVMAPIARISATAWLIPALFVVMNVATVVLAVSLRQRGWWVRAVFAWRLHHLVAVQLREVDDALTEGKPGAVIAELVRAGSGQVEDVLRSRFPAAPVGHGVTVASATCDAAVRPVLEERSAYLLSTDDAASADWFATWVERVVAVFLDVPAQPGQDVALDLHDAGRPAYHQGLLVGGILLAGSALLMVMAAFIPDAVTHIAPSTVIAVPAAAGAVLACWKFLRDRWTRTRLSH